jgi:hemolysin D
MRKDRLDYEFLPEAMEIEETPPSPFGRVVLWTIVLLTVAALLWSYFGKVDEEVVARTEGQGRRTPYRTRSHY